MRINHHCLPCIVNQAVRVAELTNAPDRDALMRKVFAYMSTIDFSLTNPEIIGTTFRLLKQHIGNPDPYKATRRYYNELLMGKSAEFERAIDESGDPLDAAIKYAILGNIIDFGPMHDTRIEDVEIALAGVLEAQLEIDCVQDMARDIKSAKRLVYLGDNCGEICLDKLLIKRLKAINPDIDICFVVRGAPVINDSIEEDAHFVGIDEFACVISNGDDSLGTVMRRTSGEFRAAMDAADVIISKGQANYESLSEERGRNIYFLLMAKCAVIAGDIGAKKGGMVCLKRCLNAC